MVIICKVCADLYQHNRHIEWEKTVDVGDTVIRYRWSSDMEECRPSGKWRVVKINCHKSDKHGLYLIEDDYGEIREWVNGYEINDTYHLGQCGKLAS